MGRKTVVIATRLAIIALGAARSGACRLRGADMRPEDDDDRRSWNVPSKPTTLGQWQVRGSGRRWPAEVLVALGLTVAVAIPLVSEGHEPIPSSDSDFRTVATKLASNLVDGTGTGGTRVRRNVKDLSGQEKARFVKAIHLLKTVPSPFDKDRTDEVENYYDQFVSWHKDLYRCDAAGHIAGEHGMTVAHGSPMFLPWHRVYVILLENALRDVSGQNITVPYWDWTDPESSRSVFSDDFMGRNGDPDDRFAVKSGPFREGAWKLNIHPEGAQWSSSKSDYLTRRMAEFDMFPKAEEVATALAVANYDTLPYDTRSEPAMSFRNTIEGFRGESVNTMECGPDGWMMTLPGVHVNPPPSEKPIEPFRFHNDVHGKVGGILAPNKDGPQIVGTMILPTSPNDPVFFLHHANVDRLWAQWQAMGPGRTYKPESGVPGMSADDVMEPFASEAGVRTTPRSVEDTSELGYRYK